MTEEELKKVKFKFLSSFSMETEHQLTYVSEDGRLGFCDRTRKRKNGGFGKTRRIYRIDKEIYKTWEEFLKALEKFNPNNNKNYG